MVCNEEKEGMDGNLLFHRIISVPPTLVSASKEGKAVNSGFPEKNPDTES